MTALKFELKNAKHFEFSGINGWEYNSKEDFKNASAVLVEVGGKHGKIKSILCDRVYFVIKGKGEFFINEEVVPVKKTDVMIVPKNTPYDFRGKMRMLLVDLPAFEKEADVKLE
jgi:mannose-6-phosphate isomerase-like protein (cupin superfamily)